ncbi:MAG: hypothetical protein HGA45_19010 [Chloroflexales bacterium]|nr:hypothetical protein [Chloroflexales bacterium]
MPHIFERFYRARNVSANTISGVGIGLFVVQEIIALHGGTMALRADAQRHHRSERGRRGQHLHPHTPRIAPPELDHKHVDDG